MSRWKLKPSKLKLSKETAKLLNEKYEELEYLCNMIPNEAYREEVKRVFKEKDFSPATIRNYLTVDNNLLIYSQPTLDDKWFDYADYRIFQKGIKGLFCGLPQTHGETIDPYIIFHTLGDAYNTTTNKNIGLWSKEVLDALFQIENYDSRDKLRSLSITFEDEWSWQKFQDEIMKYNEITWIDKEWLKRYLRQNKFKEMEWNFV